MCRCCRIYQRCYQAGPVRRKRRPQVRGRLPAGRGTAHAQTSQELTGPARARHAGPVRGFAPPWAHNGRMRVVVTRIEPDGTMQRRMVDTAWRDDGAQREDLAGRALAMTGATAGLAGIVFTRIYVRIVIATQRAIQSWQWPNRTEPVWPSRIPLHAILVYAAIGLAFIGFTDVMASWVQRLMPADRGSPRARSFRI